MATDKTLSDKVSEEIEAGADPYTGDPAHSIQPPSGDVDSLLRTVKQLKRAVDALYGSGLAMDKALTPREMLRSGMMQYSPSGGLFVQGGGTTTTVVGGGSGGSGPGYTDPRPEVDVPPAPGNLSAAGAFRSIILTWDPPAYANNAYFEVWRYTSDNLAAATAVPSNMMGQPAGNVFVDDTTTPSVTYYYWVRAVTTAGTQGPFTSSVTAAALKVGNIDLGPLVVEAANLALGSVGQDQLASGAVSASKLALQAVDLTKFANGLEPVTIVSSVPSTKSTSTIFNTADSKMYRWNGTAYAKIIPPGDVTSTELAAGSVVAGKIAADAVTSGTIAAGAINAREIAAGAITTDKLLVTGRGKALNDDPFFTDPAAWSQSAGTGTYAIVTETSSPSGVKVLRATGGVQFRARLFPATAGTRYKLSCWARKTSGTGDAWFRVYFRDSSGTPIAVEATAISPPIGTFESIGLTSTWAKYTGYIDAPVGVVDAWLITHVNWEFGVGVTDIADLRVEEYIGADLIVDGSIGASKIAAGAIAVGTAAIQNGAITNAMIANLAVDDAKIASLAGGKISAGSITGDRIAANTITGDRIQGLTITGDKILANTITADKIDSRGLSIRDTSGNIILAAGNQLDYSYITPNNNWLNSNIYINGSGQLMGIGANAGTQVANSQITISGGVISGIGTGSGTAVQNSLITITGGVISGIGTGSGTTVDNSQITITGGSISGIGTGSGTPVANTSITITGGSISGIGVGDGTAIANANITLSGSSGTITINGAGGGSVSGVVMPGNQITAANISTYIAGAAIGYAQIGSVDAGTITVGTLAAARIGAGSITADKINATSLSSITADIGTVTAGFLQNAAGTNYVNLNATGSQDFVRSAGGQVRITADGNAYFAKTLTSGTASGSWKAYEKVLDEFSNPGPLTSVSTSVLIDTGYNLPYGQTLERNLSVRLGGGMITGSISNGSLVAAGQFIAGISVELTPQVGVPQFRSGAAATGNPYGAGNTRVFIKATFTGTNPSAALSSYNGAITFSATSVNWILDFTA